MVRCIRLRGHLNQVDHFILAKHSGKVARLLGKGEIVEREITPLQGALVEKTQGGHELSTLPGPSFFSSSE